MAELTPVEWLIGYLKKFNAVTETLSLRKAFESALIKEKELGSYITTQGLQDIEFREYERGVTDSLKLQAKGHRIYEVFFTGKDDRGYITKGIKIIATSEKDAMDQANELNNTTEIFSAIEIK